MLSYNNLSVYYGSQPALSGLTYTFEPGHIYGLIGPNGCGKSTLIKTAAGLLKNYTGEVTFNGEKITSASRSKIAYMPTHPVYYGYMSPDDMGEFYEDFFNDFSRDEFNSMLAYLGLDKKQKLNNMSTGMVAKVRAAATLAREAGVILLDEPLNGIDLLGQEQVREIIHSLDLSRKVIIVASHMFDQLENMCDSVVMMHQGKVIMHGGVGTLRAYYDMSISELYRKIYAQVYSAQTMGIMGGWTK